MYARASPNYLMNMRQSIYLDIDARAKSLRIVGNFYPFLRDSEVNGSTDIIDMKQTDLEDLDLGSHEDERRLLDRRNTRAAY